MAITLKDVDRQITDLEDRIEEMKNEYLRKAGWKYTCAHPGAIWLWSKEIAGNQYHTDKTTALYIERNKK